MIAKLWIMQNAQVFKSWMEFFNLCHMVHYVQNHWPTVHLYQDKENKTIEQNEVFVKWKQLVSNLQNNGWTWLHMNWGHEKTNYYYYYYWYLKLVKCDLLMTIICLIPFDTYFCDILSLCGIQNNPYNSNCWTSHYTMLQ